MNLLQKLEDQYDHELLEQATRASRLRVASHTWEAFRMTAIEGVPAKEVAAQLSMKIATVYEARSSVLKKLKEERELLEFGRENSPSRKPERD